MDLVIITGMSGAGKSATLKFLEDFDYYCVDNLPPELIGSFAKICSRDENYIEKVAIGIDIRGGRFFNDIEKSLENLNKENIKVTVIYLEASNDILLRRFKETRRKHPMSGGADLLNDIQKEREKLEDLKSKATYIIDTSNILTRELKEIISETLIDKKDFNSLMISINSFGFKYGIPKDSDLVFDVRFIPNPFYIKELRPLTGNDIEVQQYVMDNEVSTQFLSKLYDMVTFLIPNYIKEGKNLLVINIGCTGGKHRSVTLANKLYEKLLKDEHNVVVKHGDIEKDAKRH